MIYLGLVWSGLVTRLTKVTRVIRVTQEYKMDGEITVKHEPVTMISARDVSASEKILKSRWSHLFLAMITLTIEEILKIISHMSSYTKALPTLRRPRLA